MDDQAPHGKRIAFVTMLGLIAIAAALYLYWPAGVGLGLLVGVVTTVVIGRRMQAQQARIPQDGELVFGPAEDDLRQDVQRMRAALGADYRDFARAALVVARSQWASVDALQRDLQIPANRARYLLSLLEAEGFVGAGYGSGRPVLIAAANAPELQRLLRV